MFHGKQSRFSERRDQGLSSGLRLEPELLQSTATHGQLCSSESRERSQSLSRKREKKEKRKKKSEKIAKKAL